MLVSPQSQSKVKTENWTHLVLVDTRLIFRKKILARPQKLCSSWGFLISCHFHKKVRATETYRIRKSETENSSLNAETDWVTEIDWDFKGVVVFLTQLENWYHATSFATFQLYALQNCVSDLEFSKVPFKKWFLEFGFCYHQTSHQLKGTLGPISSAPLNFITFAFW